jgi:hypothetical protein
LDPRTNKVVATIPVGPSASRLVIGEGWVWVVGVSDAYGKNPVIERINPSTNQVEGEPIRLPHPLPFCYLPESVAVGHGGLWCCANGMNRSGGSSSDRIAFIDARTTQTREIPVEHPIGGLALGDQEIWVTWATPSSGGYVYAVRP